MTNFSRHIMTKSMNNTLLRNPCTGVRYDICWRPESQDSQSIPGKIVERHYATPALRSQVRTIPMYVILAPLTWRELSLLRKWRRLLNWALPFYSREQYTQIFLLPGWIKLET